MSPILSPEGEVAAITQMGIIIAAIITAGFGFLAVTQDRTRRHAKASREQLENSHTTNLRDDITDLAVDTDKRLARIEDHLGIERTQQPGTLTAVKRRHTPRWRRRK